MDHNQVTFAFLKGKVHKVMCRQVLSINSSERHKKIIMYCMYTEQII